MEIKRNRIFGGILLIAGTAIGAGMIAMPIVTAGTGFIPSVLLLFACWLYLLCTAFLLLEVTLWLKRDVNIVTMADHTLGTVGKIIAWYVYLFLLYSLTTAYLSGCGSIFINSVEVVLREQVPSWVGPLPFLILFAYCIYLGTKPVDYINRFLMIGLIVTFLAVTILLFPNVQEVHLLRGNFTSISGSVAIIVTAFGFHIIIPTLSYYLGYRVKPLLKTIIWGSLIPLFVYILWECGVLGSVPYEGNNGLVGLQSASHPEVALIGVMAGHVKRFDIGSLLRIFGYFAILSSFLGVSLSLSDFLADGFKIKKTNKGRLLITLLTFFPPLIFSLLFPGIFVTALKYAAIFVAILLGIFPALMVWSGRYRLKKEKIFTVPGGRFLLAVIIIISLGIIFLDVTDAL